jgi:Fe-S oxidoreductase
MDICSFNVKFCKSAISAGRLIIDSIPGVNIIAESAVRGQKPEHDAVNVKIECSKCKKNCWYTIEYTDGGRKSSKG